MTGRSVWLVVTGIVLCRRRTTTTALPTAQPVPSPA